MPKADSPSSEHPPSAAGYEKRDVSVKWIVGFGGLLLACGLITHFIVDRTMKRFEKLPPATDRWMGARRTPTPATEPSAIPQLQVSPVADLKTFRAREEVALATYGWLNRTAGIVHIPIDRAMELVLQRGLPVRSDTNEMRAGPSDYQLQFKRPGYHQPEIQPPQ